MEGCFRESIRWGGVLQAARREAKATLVYGQHALLPDGTKG